MGLSHAQERALWILDRNGPSPTTTRTAGAFISGQTAKALVARGLAVYERGTDLWIGYRVVKITKAGQAALTYEGERG